MQLLVDTSADSAGDLRAVLAAIIAALNARGESYVLPAESQAAPPIVVPAAPAAPLSLDIPRPPAPTVLDDIEAARIFGGNAAPAPNVPPPPPPSAAAPVVAPTVTTATPEVAQAPASPSDLDAKGLPWDARIHAETKAKNKDGTWRTRRNLAPGVLDAVTAELRGSAAPAATAGSVPPPVASPVAAVAPPPPPPAAPVAPPPPPPAAAPTAGAVPPPPPPAGQPASVLPGDGTQPLTFPAVMKRISGAMNAGTLTKAQLDKILADSGVASPMALNSQPDKLPTVAAELAKLGV